MYCYNVDEIKEKADIVKVYETLTNKDVCAIPTRSTNCFCPFHADDNKPSLILYVKPHPEAETFCCQVCGKSGSIFHFVMWMKKVSFQESCRVIADICGINAVILASHPESDELDGSTREALNKAYEKFDDSYPTSEFNDKLFPTWLTDLRHLGKEYKRNYSEVQYSMVFDDAHKSLVIVERDDDDEIVNLRHQHKFLRDPETKALLPTLQDGKWFSYYGVPKRPIKSRFTNTMGPVLVVEGLHDELSAALLPYDYIALDTARSTVSLTEEMSANLMDRHVIMFPDADVAGQQMIDNNLELLQSVSKKVEVALFSELVNGDTKKMDFTDFMFTFSSVQKFLSCIKDLEKWASELAEKAYGLSFVNLDGPPKTLEEQKDDFINIGLLPMPRNRVSLITAPGGTGKTFLSLRILVNYVLTEERMAIYFATEETLDILEDRLKRLLQEVFEYKDEELLAITKKVTSMLQVITCDNEIVPLVSSEGNQVCRNEAEIAKFRRAISRAGLVILDPLISFYAGQENDNSSARSFMNIFNEITAKDDVTIVFVHHSAKGTTNARGASAFVDAARALYELSTIDEEDEFWQELFDNYGVYEKSAIREVRITKDNYGAARFLAGSRKKSAADYIEIFPKKQKVWIKMFPGREAKKGEA